jgi:PmbA protein
VLQADSLPGNDFDAARLENLVALALDEAAAQGASAAEIGLSQDSGLSVGVRLGEVETIEHHRSQGLGITVYFGQRKGSASTTDLGAKALRESVAAACRIARFAAEDEYAGLPEAGMLATHFPDLALYHPWALTPEEGIRYALTCERAALTHDAAITNSDGASINTFSGYRVLGNSLGFLHGFASSRHSLSCSVIGQRGDSMQRDDWWTVARSKEGLEPAEAVGVKAAERTVQRLGACSLTTRLCPVVFAADLAGGFFGHFIAAIRGGNLYRKTSFLLDSLGQQIFPDFLHIHEQPYIPGALGSAAFDGEGVQTRAHDLILGGVLQSYVLSTYSARKLGMTTTGNAGGVHNLTIDPGNQDLAGLLKTMNTGLLVTELMGQGINLVTGDYSRGAAGFWVENGVIQYPVEEITIAGNLRDMFMNVVAVGNDVDKRGGTWSGSVLVEQMTVAGN